MYSHEGVRRTGVYSHEGVRRTGMYSHEGGAVSWSLSPTPGGLLFSSQLLVGW